MDKRECVPHNSNKNKLKVIVGTTLSGILIIALALMVGIAVYRNKCRRKEQGAANGSNGSLSCTDFTKYYYKCYNMICRVGVCPLSEIILIVL
jgi:hypothetical protein